MNAKGFCGNMLWLARSESGTRDDRRTGLCVSQRLRFCLDNLATVGEAVSYFQTHDVPILWASAGDSFKKRLTVHLALGDRTGDRAVIEYVGAREMVYSLGVILFHALDGRLSCEGPPASNAGAETDRSPTAGSVVAPTQA